MLKYLTVAKTAWGLVANPISTNRWTNCFEPLPFNASPVLLAYRITQSPLVYAR